MNQHGEDAAEGILALAEGWELRVRAAREAGDLADILGVARAAVDALEAALGQAAAPDTAQLEAMYMLRKITYNCAADAYPGWEFDAPPRDAAALADAADLARKSLSLVEQLQEDAEHHGHAVWLIGALAMAQGQRAQAQAEFHTAAQWFTAAEAPLMVALAQGYGAIATGDAAALASAQANIPPDDQHAKAVLEQLAIGWSIYGQEH